MRRDWRIDVSTIGQWNSAFDRYMRHRVCQQFPTHPVMAQHMTDLSTAPSSQFTDNWIVKQRLQRECAVSTCFQTLHATAVQQFNTYYMNDSFRDMIAKGWFVIYMGDLLIASPDPATYAEWTCHVFQWMTELDLHLKLEKCQFDVPEVEYLGMIVKPGQLAINPVKLDGIAAWPTPTKVKDVWSFLGFANFYH